MNPFFQQLFNAARNRAGGVLRSLEVQGLRNMGPSIRRAIGPGVSYSTGAITAATKQDPSRLRAFPSAVLASPVLRASLGLAGTGVIKGTADKIGLTDVIEGGLNQIGPGLDRFFGAITPQPVQRFGRDMEQYGFGALGGFVPGEYRGESQAIPERARGTQAILNGKTVYWTGKKYGWQSGPSALKAGLLGSEVVGDDAFASVDVPALPGLRSKVDDGPALPPPPLTTSTALAERAYQQELSRTAQLTAQDPELQRYENARKAAKTQEEMNAVRDMGMEIWAKAHPTLAAKVQPGQSGFDIIYKQTGVVPSPTVNRLMEDEFFSRGAGELTTGPSPLVPQADPALNPAGPTYALGEEPSFYNFSNESLTPEMIKAFQKQLLEQAGTK